MATETTASAVRTEDVTATALPPGPRWPQAVQTLLYGSYRDRWMPRLRRRYGDVFRLRIFPERDVVQLADVEHIRAVFSGPTDVFHAGEGNAILKPAMGRHSVLLTDEDRSEERRVGKEWRRRWAADRGKDKEQQLSG